jgi:DNA recombination protein RmuC
MGIAAIIVAGVSAAVAAALAAIVLAALRRRPQPQPENQGLALLQQQLEALRQQTTEALRANEQTMRQSLTDVTGQVSERLDRTAQVVSDVSSRLGQVSESSRRILEVGQDIASLQEILRAPKLRGVIGELFLGDLLRQLLPNNHELQHRFRSGETVDAVVKLGPRLVPVDAKFPLENFQRLVAATDDAERKALRRRFSADVKKHVDAIAQKYIRPDEGTFDFALMYIPAENVYYETVIKPDTGDEPISTYAVSRRVIPVSPNTLYANLQTIVLGLRGFQVEQRAAEILDLLARLQTDLARFRESFDTVGKHLANAHNKYEETVRQLSRFEDRLALTAADRSAPDPSDRALPGGV